MAQHAEAVEEFLELTLARQKEHFLCLEYRNRSKQVYERTSRKDEASGKTSGSPRNLWEQMPWKKPEGLG